MVIHPRGNRDAPYLKISQRDCGGISIIYHLVGVKSSDTTVAPEEHLAIPAFKARRPAGEIGFCSAVAYVNRGKFSGRWIKPGNSVVRSDPKIAMLIFENAPNYLSRKTVRLVVIRKVTRCRVKFSKTILGTNPDMASAIDMDEIREVITYLAWFIAQAFVRSECFRPRIKTVKAAHCRSTKSPHDHPL